MSLNRRRFLGLTAASLAGEPALDRRALVSRHNPVLTSIDLRSPLSVGNGEFAFTADITGLQTFADAYEHTVPLCTQAQWAWHSFPIPQGLDPRKFRLEMFDTFGRKVGYATSAKGQEPLFNWLRENPHRLNLARIGLLLNGRTPDVEDITDAVQKLDLWTGALESRYHLRGVPLSVLTCCHPELDAIAVSIRSPQVVSVGFDFPYGSTTISASDWRNSQRHRSQVLSNGRGLLQVHRQLDTDEYFVRLQWDGDAQAEQTGDHRIVLSGRDLSFICGFSPGRQDFSNVTPRATREVSASHWSSFWSGGGAIDLSGSRDHRAGELERRIVLSQYLTAIQCSGSAPPQETGLTCNSWFGKFHLEMHWWHAAHFALWGRAALLERSLGWYTGILPVAREKARKQGYRGARWPKMTALAGCDSPSPIGELLIWQQPHPIALPELCYRSHPTLETLQRYREVVAASADFMASYAVLRDGRYVLGPPVIPAQENHPPRETWNPTFELAYWRQALGIAQEWRMRLGNSREPVWDQLISKLSALPQKDGVYLAHENCPQTFTERNRDHPSMLAAFGVLSGEGVDRETMRRTLLKVMRDWHWPETWGWDFPMVAMTAARLGEPALAIDALFIDSPKNTWLRNGHNWQRPNLPVYLPGNGGLLAAVAMMASAWDGFPKPGWIVKWEGLHALL